MCIRDSVKEAEENEENKSESGMKETRRSKESIFKEIHRGNLAPDMDKKIEKVIEEVADNDGAQRK